MLKRMPEITPFLSRSHKNGIQAAKKTFWKLSPVTFCSFIGLTIAMILWISMNKNLIEMTKTLNGSKSGSDYFIWAPNHIGKGLYCWAVMNADRGYSGGPVSPMTGMSRCYNFHKCSPWDYLEFFTGDFFWEWNKLTPQTHIRKFEILYFSDNISKITMIQNFFCSEKRTSIYRENFTMESIP